ncbi:MAG TPA: hypothetical protein VGM90_38400 [Kofleriaceae bacterium]|jgi:hypothetical protein
MTWLRTSALLVPVLLLASTAHAEDGDDSSVSDEGETTGDAPPLSVYGFARLDVLANDSRMSDVSQPFWVMPEPAAGRVDSEMTMSPRLSRFGLSIDEWDLGGDMTGSGLIEVDFGGGQGVNALRLRHAYAKLVFDQFIEVLAGQTWDLASPLAPTVQTDTQMLFAGNTGDRRPQLRMSLLSKHVRFGVAAAATGTLDQRDLDGDGQLDGVASGTPSIQGLLEVRGGRGLDSDGRLALWSHVGTDALANGDRTTASAFGLSFILPATRAVRFQGELYFGSNAADIGGGIGQGVNKMTGKPIHAYGGWFEGAFAATDKHLLALGVTMDRAREADLEMGDRTQNQTMYAALRYKPRSALQLGLDYLHWVTDYAGMSDGVANRFDAYLSVFF